MELKCMPNHGSVLQVIRFPEAVEAAVEELMPNRITDYLYDLSEKFNGFYTECHVSLCHPVWTMLCAPLCCPMLFANRITYQYVITHCVVPAVILHQAVERDCRNNLLAVVQVVGDKQQTSRLLLCEATAVVMRQCFDLLGMTPMYQI